MTMNDCNYYSSFGFGCTTSFTAVSSGDADGVDESELADDMYAAAAILVVAGVAFLVVRKRRMKAKLNLDEESGDGATTDHFKRMEDFRAGVQA